MRGDNIGLCMQASAMGGILAGLLADWLLVSRGWRTVQVRRLIQTVATLGQSSGRITCTLHSSKPA